MFSQYDIFLCVTIAAFALLSGKGTSATGQLNPEAFRETIDVDFSGKTQTTQEPPEGNMTETECQNYNLKIGITNIQYYSCCGGLKNKTIEYEPFFASFHCNPTRLRYGLLNVTTRYNCNGLEGQRNAKSRCSDRWGWVDEPIDCWMWSDCFAGACEQEVIQLGSSADLETPFCGDGRCDGAEDTQNCAIDCCQVENSECVAFNNTCPEACCAESTCCLDADSATALLVKKVWMILLGIVAFLAILILVGCCCICYCCYSKCCKKKKQRRYSQMDVEMRSNSSPN